MLAALVMMLCAASSVHLSDLLHEARAHNPDLRAATARAQAARETVRSSDAWDDPMLSAQLWNMPLDFSMVPLMVELSIPIELGGKRAARRGVAQAEAHLTEAELAGQKRALDAAVAAAYFDMYMAERTLDINSQLQQTLQALLEVATHRASTGLSEPTEALRLQSEWVALDGQNVVLRAERATANAKLVGLLARAPDSDVGSPAPPSAPMALPSQATLRARAQETQPELLALRAAVARGQAEAQLAEAEGSVTLAPMIGYMRDFGGEGERNFGILGVQGNLPVFRASKIAPRVRAAQARVRGLEASLEGLVNKLGSDIAGLYAQADAEAQTIAIHHRLIPLSQQTLSSAMSSYTVGRGGFLDVLVSLRDVQTHQLDLAKHLAAYEQRVADLQRVTGLDLGLDSDAPAAAGHEAALAPTQDERHEGQVE